MKNKFYKIISVCFIGLFIFSGCTNLKVNKKDNIINDKYVVDLVDYYVAKLDYNMFFSDSESIKNRLVVELNITNNTDKEIFAEDILFAKANNHTFGGAWGAEPEVQYVRFFDEKTREKTPIKQGETARIAKTFYYDGTNIFKNINVYLYEKADNNRDDYIKFKLKF